MMGSGKSSVGPVLARRLGRPFVDSDGRVEELAGCDIPEIFALQGEAAFRVLETRAIDEAIAGNAVVALGGGAIAAPGAPAKLARAGTVVYLRVRLETLCRRLEGGAGRPLLAGLDDDGRRERVRDMLSEREPAYLTAGIVVETDEMSVDQTADAVLQALGPGARE
jgi:shikimate kinase